MLFPISTNAIVYEVGSNGGIYVGTDIGIFYINNDLVNWIPYSEGLPNTVVSELEIQYSSGKIRAATFGRGAWQSDLFSGIEQTPEADFIASAISVCEGEVVTFTDQSTYHEIGWDWEFEGGSPSVSAEQNPEVVYETAGNYSVSLGVANAIGGDQVTKTEYVHVIPALGEELPFLEDFQSMTSLDETQRWFVQNDNEDVTWEHTDQYGYNSNSSVWIRNFENTIDFEDRLFSKTIDLSGAAGVVLTMDVAFAQKTEDDKDKLKVYVSSNCGSSWSLKKTFTGNSSLKSVEPQDTEFFPSSDADWHNLAVTNINESNLSESFRMQLYFENDGGNNLFVDNINITSLVTGLVDIDLANLDLQLVPNPTDGHSDLRFFLLGDKEVSYQVMDMTGRVMENVSLGNLGYGDHITPLSAEEWAPGIYLLSLDIDGKREQIRWVVK